MARGATVAGAHATSRDARAVRHHARRTAVARRRAASLVGSYPQRDWLVDRAKLAWQVPAASQVSGAPADRNYCGLISFAGRYSLLSGGKCSGTGKSSALYGAWLAAGGRRVRACPDTACARAERLRPAVSAGVNGSRLPRRPGSPTGRSASRPRSGPEPGSAAEPGSGAGSRPEAGPRPRAESGGAAIRLLWSLGIRL